MYTRTFRFIHTAITLSAFFGASAVFADESSSWLEQQRSISDGYSPANETANPNGARDGNVYVGAKFESPQEDFVLRGRQITDGYSPANGLASANGERNDNLYVGAKLESFEEDFVLRGRQITDGATE